MNGLLDAIGDIGYALDTPGAYLRGVLGGRPGERLGGRGMLENWGVLGENPEGLDWGDAAGFGVDALTDPLTWAAPAYGAYKGAKAGLSGLGDAATLARRLGEIGEVAPLERRLAELAGGEHSVGLFPPVSLGPTARGLDASVLHAPPLPDPVTEGLSIARGPGTAELRRGEEVLGDATFSGRAGPMERRAVRSVPEFASRVPEGAPVGRFHDVGLYDTPVELSRALDPSELGPLAGRGYGQQLTVDALAGAPYEWAYNSQASPAAHAMLDRLSSKGLLELVRDPAAAARRGPNSSPYVMRLTDEGRRVAGTMGLVHPRVTPDPMDVLRANYRNTVGKANPLADQLGGLLSDEEASLRPFQEVGRRADPDFINAKEWFHGNATPRLTPEALDPMKTDPGALFGRGIYQTEDPFLAGEYAEARGASAARRWGDEASLKIPGRQAFEPPGPETPPGIDLALGALVRDNPDFFSQDPKLREYLLDQFLASRRPGEFSREVLRRTGRPDMAAASRDALAPFGIELPPFPKPTVYKAGADVGSVLDADLPLDPRLRVAMTDMTRSLRPIYEEGRSSWSRTSPSDWLAEAIAAPGATNADILGMARHSGYLTLPPGAPDPMTVALRRFGWDAITHTGGQRAGLGRNPLHQVLVTLDPNDTVARVGRGPHITRFDQMDPEAIRSLLGWQTE